MSATGDVSPLDLDLPVYEMGGYIRWSLGPLM